MDLQSTTLENLNLKAEYWQEKVLCFVLGHLWDSILTPSAWPKEAVFNSMLTTQIAGSSNCCAVLAASLMLVALIWKESDQLPAEGGNGLPILAVVRVTGTVRQLPCVTSWVESFC